MRLSNILLLIFLIITGFSGFNFIISTYAEILEFDNYMIGKCNLTANDYSNYESCKEYYKSEFQKDNFPSSFIWIIIMMGSMFACAIIFFNIFANHEFA